MRRLEMQHQRGSSPHFRGYSPVHRRSPWVFCRSSESEGDMPYKLAWRRRKQAFLSGSSFLPFLDSNSENPSRPKKYSW